MIGLGAGRCAAVDRLAVIADLAAVADLAARSVIDVRRRVREVTDLGAGAAAGGKKRARCEY